MLNNEVSICVDICRTILIDGRYKRCYADVGTDNMEVKETRNYKKYILNCGVLLFIFFYPYSKVQWSKLLNRYGSNIYSGLRLK